MGEHSISIEGLAVGLVKLEKEIVAQNVSGAVQVAVSVEILWPTVGFALENPATSAEAVLQTQG